MPRSAGDHKIIINESVVTLDATGDKLTVAPARPILVHRYGALVTIATTGTNVILNLDHERAGGAALSVSGANVGGALTGGDETAGLGFYKDATDFANGKPILVLPGEQIVVAVATAATAGDGRCFIEVEELPMVDANFVRLDGAGNEESGTYLQYLTKRAA